MTPREHRQIEDQLLRACEAIAGRAMSRQQRLVERRNLHARLQSYNADLVQPGSDCELAEMIDLVPDATRLAYKEAARHIAGLNRVPAAEVLQILQTLMGEHYDPQ